MDDFEAHRPLLFDIAYRMLSSVSDAEDIVQDAYLRYAAAPRASIRSPRSFLATIVTRPCLNQLHSARVQRETYIGPWLPEPLVTPDESQGVFDKPEEEETISMAFLVLLEQLTPLARAVFLLREVFDYEYSDIAQIVERDAAACRQIFSRARRELASGGGETPDALLIYLPASGVMFTGDVFMPFLGAPFLAEGSAEGLFDALELIQRVAPRLLVHGHTPLNERVLEGLGAAETLVQILRRNVLPEVLRSNPAAVMPYLLMRENFVKRVYHQRSGYWKPGGEGIEVFGPDEWAAALALLADGRPEAFVGSARTLLERHDDALALRVVELGLHNFGESRELAELRQQALQRLRALNQQLNPFKFIVYSEWARSELAPVD